MTKRALIAVMALLLGGLALTPVAHGHPYLYYGPIDSSGNTMTPEPWANLLQVATAYDTHVGAMMTPTTGATSGCNLWIGACAQPAIWQSVKGQQGPSWLTTDNGNVGTPTYAYQSNGSVDSVKFQMLDEVLSTSTCLDGLAANTVSAIRTAFGTNKAAAENAELTLNNVHITANFTYIVALTVDSYQTITTGNSTQNIVASGLISYTIPPQAIPNLFKTDKSLLRSANQYIRDATVNMAAAYMTIGDTRITNYWFAYIGTMGGVAVNQMLPSLLAGIGKSDEASLTAADLSSAFTLAMGVAMRVPRISPADPADKAAQACPPWGTVNDLDITVPVTVSPIGTINIRIRQTGGELCTSLGGFASKFVIGPGHFEGRAQYLATDATGNLNGDAQTNLASYTVAAGDANTYLQQESARPNFTAGALAAPPAQTYGATYTLTSAALYNGSTAGIAYQWSSSPDGVTWTPITFANGPTYGALVNFYSFGAVVNTRYYKCAASVSCSGQPYNRETNAVSIDGPAPPAINFANATGGGNYIPGGSATLSVDATVGVGGPLTYQWQKFDGASWVDIPGKTDHVMTLVPLTGADAGQYRLVAFNLVAGKSDKANPQYFNVSNPLTIAVAPTITIDTPPVGADLAIGGSHTMNVVASVTSGTLSYQWQRNIGFGWQNIGGQTTDTLALNSVTVNDAGRYRVTVTNTEPTYGTYSINTAAVTVNVSSGVVFLVDPTSTGTEDGLTWATAFHTLQAGIDAANLAGGGEVWVAGGSIGAPIVYNEVRTELWGNTPVDGSLVMKANVAMYGGFSGYRSGTGALEVNRRDRSRYLNPVVIDGSVSRGGSPAYHVVVFGTNTGPSSNTTLDGFSITGGNAAGVASDYHTWRGGGIYNWQSTPTISNCTFYGNNAEVSGGAVSNETNGGNGAGAQFTNCLFSSNFANRVADTDGNPIRGGGAVFNDKANASFTWCTLAMNSADNLGYTLFGADSAAMYTWDGSPIVNSSVAWENAGVNAVQEDVTFGSVQAMAVSYSNTQGAAIGGTGNISADPLFTSAGVDFTLLIGSPSVDTGDPALSGDDLRGVQRPLNGGVALQSDMGAYELSLNPPAPVCLTQTINISVLTSITDPLDVFDATNSVVEAGIQSIAIDPNSFVCGDIPLKTNGVTIVVTDLLGRTGSCSADVNVFEDTPPTAISTGIVVTLDATGNYTLTPADVQLIGTGSTDNCTIDWAASSATPSSFTCANVGTPVSVTLTVKDQSGNAATADTLVTVQDLTPPDPVGGNNIDVSLSVLGEYTLNVSDVQSLGTGSSDACGINWVNSSVVPNTFSCADLGAPVSVDLTVVDSNGNVALASVPGTVTVHDVTGGVLSGIGAQAFVKNLGAYTTALALAGVTANDLCYGDITASVVVTAVDDLLNPVSFPIPDTAAVYPAVFTLTYTATDGSGNAVSVDTQLTLVDNTPPVITVFGSNPVTIECHDVYVDAGAGAFDVESGDLTGAMGVVGLPIPTGTPGSYNVTYSVQDPISGVIVEEVRVVNVVDTSIPVITLLGGTTIGWQRGVVFVDPGATAADDCAGALTVNVTGTVDTNIAGDYILTYDATDGFNAALTVTRTVVVGDLVNWTTQPVGGDLYSTAPITPPLTVTAVFTDGVAPVTSYQWVVKQGAAVFPIGSPAAIPPGNILVAVIPATLPIPAGDYEVFVRVVDGTGNNDSDHAIVRLGAHLGSATGLTDASFLVGDNYDWAISVSGGIGTVTYQWMKDDGAKAMVPIADGGGITGTNSNTLHFAPFAAPMAGMYQVDVSDANETITVGPATITVGSGVPVGSALGLAALAAMTALGGATSLRRRKK